MQQGLAPSDEEVQSYMEEYIASVSASQGYEKLEAVFENMGTSFGEYTRKSQQYFVRQMTIERLYQKKREEFRMGMDQCGDKVCDSAEEYWQEFIKHEIE